MSSPAPPPLLLAPALLLLALACGGQPPGAVPAEPVRGAPIDSAPRGAGPDEAPPSAAPTETAAPPPAEIPNEEAAGEEAAGEEPDDAVPPGHLANAHRSSGRLERAEKGLPVVGDTTTVTFSDLAFAGGDTVTKAEKEIPAGIRALDGERVAVDGFMVPMDFEEDEVRSFLLTRFPPGCCFGMLPAMDQWIDVEMVSEAGAELAEMRIVRVTGTFEVGELLDDYGYLTSVYRLDAESAVSQW